MTTLLTITIALLCQGGPPPTQPEVDGAIDRGAAWLMSYVKRGLPGEVSVNSGKGLRYDSLVLYTLVHAGVDREDRSFQDLVRSVANRKITRTYTAACVAVALNALSSSKYRSKIYQCAQFLVDNQCQNGQWDYGRPFDIPTIPVEKGGVTRSKIRVGTTSKLKPTLHGDNSNSQYAALGLYACWQAGFEFDRKFLTRAINWWEGSQRGDGSWNYCENGRNEAAIAGFGAMTAGGGASLIMLRKVRGGSGRSSTAKKAIAWLGAKFSVSDHPAAPPDRQRFHFYYLYALERLGDLSKTKKMGRHKWYDEGARWLLANQHQGGMWQGTQRGREISATCFAILFLERAMKVATGGRKR
jgi:hypothetical protein